jgi:hypothetical protein
MSRFGDHHPVDGERAVSSSDDRRASFVPRGKGNGSALMLSLVDNNSGTTALYNLKN